MTPTIAMTAIRGVEVLKPVRAGLSLSTAIQLVYGQAAKWYICGMGISLG